MSSFFIVVHRIIKADENTGLFQYFIRVIPTIYTDESYKEIYTNQYTLTDRFRPLIVPTVDIHAPPQVRESILQLLSLCTLARFPHHRSEASWRFFFDDIINWILKV